MTADRDRPKSLLEEGSRPLPQSLFSLQLYRVQWPITVVMDSPRKSAFCIFLSPRAGSVQYLIALIQFKNILRLLANIMQAG